MNFIRRSCNLWKLGLRYYSKIGNHGRSTIFALSTSPGISAVAIIRVSGPDAKQVLFQITNVHNIPSPRKAVLRKIFDPFTNEHLDNGLLLWFPSPNSYTGEDICELHVHGGLSVTRTILKALSKLPSFRHAEPGEFTKRAFLAGKLDLTEIEGLADLLNAETEAQQRQALRQMEGCSFKLYSEWTDRIKKCLAGIEAYIDFSEDQNLDSSVLHNVSENVRKLQKEMQNHIGDNHRGERLRNGVRVVLIGKPNVGKSSLLNAICKNDVAIVSSIPGTTRDVIERSVNLDGYLVHLSDTAGLREIADEIEQEGMKRACKKLDDADIVVFLMEAETAIRILQNYETLTCEIPKRALKKELGATVGLGNSLLENEKSSSSLPKNAVVFLVLNKIDLLSSEDVAKLTEIEQGNRMVAGLSCVTGVGVNEFLDLLSIEVKNMCIPLGEEPTITQDRHRQHIMNCLECLDDYQSCLSIDAAIAAEQLRKTTVELGRITGKITTDDILNVIFRSFCIGK